MTEEVEGEAKPWGIATACGLAMTEEVEGEAEPWGIATAYGLAMTFFR